MTLNDEQKADQFKQWSGIKAAERAAALATLLQEGKMVRSNAQTLQDAHREKLGLGPAEEEEEMGIQVGDNVTHVHQQLPPQPPQIPAQPVSDSGDFLKKAALYGGLLASGAGGAFLVSQMTKDQPPVPPQKEVIQSQGPDSDTQYELRISSGE